MHACLFRMLRLKLTDGKTTCKAVEMRPLPDMSTEELPPGTKVCISNASVKAGLLLLDSKSIKVGTSSTCRPAYL